MRIAIVGRGLIGSAAAKHLARSGAHVTLIGPDEPADWAAHEGVFASHYDEGRITRALDPDPFWSRVSRASIARYAEIEATSGVRFYTEAGSLMAGAAGGDMMSSVARVAKEASIAAEWMTPGEVNTRFPFLHLKADDQAAYEAKGAGHVSPRNLVRAQGICAEAAGAKIVAEEVRGIDDGASVTLRTAQGDLHFDHVLVAVGAFCRSLLGDVAADVTPYARTVAFFELDKAETARLSTMPTVIHKTAEDAPYILPPIRYPNGKTYIKLGGEPQDHELRDPKDLNAWYRSGGSAEIGAYLRDVLLRRIPDLRYEAMHVAPCSTTFTPEDKPRIGPVSKNVTAAIAGCGRGAKCSDELGRMAAEAVLTGVAAPVAA